MNREGYVFNVSWYCAETGLTESVMCESRAEMDNLIDALIYLGVKLESIYYEFVEVPSVDPEGRLATRRALGNTPNINSAQKHMLEGAIDRVEAQIKASLGDRLYEDLNARRKS